MFRKRGGVIIYVCDFSSFLICPQPAVQSQEDSVVKEPFEINLQPITPR